MGQTILRCHILGVTAKCSGFLFFLSTVLITAKYSQVFGGRGWSVLTMKELVRKLSIP